MFPLFTTRFPDSADELQRLMNDSLRRVFITPRDPVKVDAPQFPAIEALTVTLDGAELRSDPPPPARTTPRSDTTIAVRKFTMNGQEVAIGPAPFDVQLDADELQFAPGETDNGEIVLIPESAAAGRLQIEVAVAALEQLIATVAAREAGKHGVTIDSVRLQLRQFGERSLGADVHVRARKLFLSASVRITGQLEIDGELNARVSGLRCNGEGMVANIACGVLAPQLARVDGKQFSLMALPLGEIRLRDLRITTGERLTVTADFGRA